MSRRIGGTDAARLSSDNYYLFMENKNTDANQGQNQSGKSETQGQNDSKSQGEISA